MDPERDRLLKNKHSFEGVFRLMLNEYLAIEQEQRLQQATEEYNEAVVSIEFQARKDAAMGAEPHPDGLWDDCYWQEFCCALRHYYSRKYKKYPPSVVLSKEDLF